jgi:L-seryl-tRNA(Ser) seleniumtransferase
VDKITYALLEATLLEYARGTARETIPVVRMLTCPREAIQARAAALAGRLAAAGWRTAVIDGWSAVGGGAAPGTQLPTWLVRLEGGALGADDLLAALRRLHPPVIARIADGAVVLDLRTVDPLDDDELAGALAGLADAATPAHADGAR